MPVIHGSTRRTLTSWDFSACRIEYSALLDILTDAHWSVKSRWLSKFLTCTITCKRESHRERPGLHREGCSLTTTPPQDCPSPRGCAGTAAASSAPVTQACHFIGQLRAALALRHHQQQTQSQSLQTSNVNSSSLNLFEVVTTAFQQINVAESEEGRIVAITKIVLKFIMQCNMYFWVWPRQMTHPSSRQTAPHIDKTETVLTVTKIRSWTPEGDWHRDWVVDWPSIAMWLLLVCLFWGR
jgi:hypothetical protein